jgi:hypothetical protein
VSIELYDLNADIGEKSNLAEAHPEKASELHEKLIAWRESINAPVPTQSNPNYDPEAEAAAVKKLLQNNQ